MLSTVAYRDGQFMLKSEIHIGLDDLGFERGFGVFDYLRVKDGKITFLNDHLKRLNHSQEVLQFDQPANMELIRDIILELHQKNALTDAYFKVIITGRFKDQQIEPIITIYQDIWCPYPTEMYTQGISLIFEEFNKPFPQYKTTFYLGSFRSYNRMKMNNSEDVLFYYENTIRECARCNIFMVKNGLIYTPDKNMLSGVTRNHVITCAKINTIVIEKDISVQELFAADEVFITSTTRNIMPVVKIEDKNIHNGIPGVVTMELMSSFEKYYNAYAE